MRLLVTEQKWIAVNKRAQERLAKCRQSNLCLACMQPIEAGEEVLRGVHMRCYHATYRAVRMGKTTMEKRVAEGKLGECKPSGRKPSNPVTAELS